MSDDERASSLRLRDGRTLAWSEQGVPDGFPVLSLHGTPGSRHHMLVDEAPALSAGVRLIAPDRPGYGSSTFHPGHALRDSADDLEQLADHLGLERFAVAGLSGGGPHALAAAHHLRPRVTAVALLSSVGSVRERGSEAGMMPVNRLISRIARRAPSANRPLFSLMAAASRRWPDALLDRSAKVLVPADSSLLERPAVREAFRRDFATTSKTSGRAAAQDFGLAAHDWGFRLEDLAVPTFVWQGDTDHNVPLAHGRRMAATIPGAVLHVVPGGGHFVSIEHLREIYSELVAASA